MPVSRPRSRVETAVSILIHVAIIWFALRAPSYIGEVIPVEQGAGGPGPAGGGGGFRAEIIQYVEVRPAPPPQAKPTLVFTPPEIKPVPPPEVEPPKLEPIAMPAVPSAGVTTSADPNGGSGPGTGGGVGTGVGTGKGSSVGPGTGGGDQPNFPPQPTEMFIPPLPVPASVRGTRVIAEFDVDEKGKVLGMTFTGTNDRGYNRRLRDVLNTFRFRPGHRPDGTPVRMKAQVSIDLP
jgi:protein TonB